MYSSWREILSLLALELRLWDLEKWLSKLLALARPTRMKITQLFLSVKELQKKEPLVQLQQSENTDTGPSVSSLVIPQIQF